MEYMYVLHNLTVGCGNMLSKQYKYFDTYMQVLISMSYICMYTTYTHHSKISS